MFDLIFLVVIVIAAIKGIQRGFIVAIFSIVAIVIGLAAAVKLSTVAADYLNDSVNISARWLPVISFILVFLLVVVLVRLGANLLQKTVEIAFLGWLNKLVGSILYVLLYTIVFSVLLFFANQLHLIQEETIRDSRVYAWVEPIGPYVIDGIGKILPFFKDMFQELKAFFENISTGLPAK
ncbi:MAG: CvpA family protein [Chitinophagaceae bacterium]|nr:CvpA family protein [Chitinophagaceae bacterium]